MNIKDVLGSTWKYCEKYATWHADFSDADVKEVSSVGDLCRNPVFSVVVITYQQEKYIEQCLQSICSQVTNFSFEVIVSDDCSGDLTLKYCLEMREKYPDKIRVLCSECNVGPVANINRVALRVRGRYVAICEGDDFWCEKTKLQRQFARFEMDESVAVVHTGGCLQYETCVWSRCSDSSKLRKRLLSYNELSQRKQQEILLGGNFISTPSVAMRASAFQYAIDKMNGLERITGWIPSCDFILWVFCLDRGKLFYDSSIAVVRRINAGSLTGIADKKKALSRQLGDARNSVVLREMYGVDAGLEKVWRLLNKLKHENAHGNYRPHRGPLYFLLRRVLIEFFGF